MRPTFSTFVHLEVFVEVEALASARTIRAYTGNISVLLLLNIHFVFKMYRLQLDVWLILWECYLCFDSILMICGVSLGDVDKDSEQ